MTVPGVHPKTVPEKVEHSNKNITTAFYRLAIRFKCKHETAMPGKRFDTEKAFAPPARDISNISCHGGQVHKVKSFREQVAQVLICSVKI